MLLFMDIDMLVTPDLVTQCRRHVRQGATAWYPISFSQYDPDRLCFEERFFHDRSIGADAIVGPGRERIRDQIQRTPLVLSEERGFWRDFGFGIACVYKLDFLRAGGFNLAIEGWGREDVDLYLSLLKSDLDVFRSNQVDLIHIFHSKHCSESLTGEQRRSCFQTQATHYASQRCLSVAFRNRQLTRKEMTPKF